MDQIKQMKKSISILFELIKIVGTENKKLQKELDEINLRLDVALESLLRRI